MKLCLLYNHMHTSLNSCILVLCALKNFHYIFFKSGNDQFNINNLLYSIFFSGRLIDYFTTDIVQNTPPVIEVRWGVQEQVSNWTIDISLTYKKVKVAGTDCPLLSDPPVSM